VTAPLLTIPVGVAVERRHGKSPWAGELWRPIAVFDGVPAAAPWTIINAAEDVTTFYAGKAVIELYRTETDNYRNNLASGLPSLWVILRRTGEGSTVELRGVTADPAEGEALTGVGDDLVESVPMVAAIGEKLKAFIAQHHVERPMFNRQRDRSGRPS
jgi:hypothetical protein